MWRLYTLLLLLNSSCGATRYTRRNRHNQDHHNERFIESLDNVHHSEGRASKKANIVDNEFLDGRDSSDGVERKCTYLVRISSRKVLVRGTWCTHSRNICQVPSSHPYVLYTFVIHTTMNLNISIALYSYSCIKF